MCANEKLEKGKLKKKLLAVVAVCLAVLLAAVGAYAYTQISNMQNQIDSMNNKKSFNFFWQGPIAEKLNVTTFWLNVTFERTNETHLIITVKVNDLGYSYCVGIAFDVNHNGEIDEDDQGYVYGALPYYIAPDTTTKHYGATPAFLGPYREDGQRFFQSFAECTIDDLHTCDFDSELGYTYIIAVNLQDVLWQRFPHKVVELINDLIHVEYWGNMQDGKASLVSVEFCFGIELIT